MIRKILLLIGLSFIGQVCLADIQHFLHNDIEVVHYKSFEKYTEVTGVVVPAVAVNLSSMISAPITWIETHDGLCVHQGDVLVRFQQESFLYNFHHASVQWRAAKVTHRNEYLHLKQAVSLFKEHFISLSALEDALSRYELSVADLETKKSAFKQASLDLDRTILRSPIDGCIQGHYAQLGQAVTLGSRLIDLLDPNQKEWRFSLIAKDIHRVHVGQTINLIHGDETISVLVSRVTPMVESGTDTVTVYADLDKKDFILGEFLTGILGLEKLEHVIVVPNAAVHTDAKNHSFVYVIDATNAIKQKNITIKTEFRGATVVDTGLEDGDMVISRDLGNFVEGTQAVIVDR